MSSIFLARLPNRGCVRVCPGGCVHVTYSGVTLDFTAEGFLDFAATMERHFVNPSIQEVEVTCFHVLLRFTRNEYREFTSLAGEGKRNLLLWQSRQREETEETDTLSPRPFNMEEPLFSGN